MSTTKSLFFDLLRNALWYVKEDLPKELSAQTADRILKDAEQQAVSGLVIDALIRHDVRIPKQCVLEAVGVLEQIKQQGRTINEGAVKLNQLMSEAGVSYVIVKGQVVASRYPEPLLRQAGDIDYYCDARNFPLSQELIKNNWGIEAERGESDLHVHFNYSGVTYEGHFSLTSLYDKQKNRYWQQLLDTDKGAIVTIDGVEVKTLSPTLHTLYIFLHLYHHLMELGVGLRQFCDMAVMLHNNDNLNPNLNELREHLMVLGMEKAYRACGSILVDYLGLSEEELGFSLNDRDRRYGRKILDVVFYRGNMGYYNKRNGFRGWKHKVEAVGIKASHFLKFMPLAPGYSCSWLWHEFWRKI